MILYLLLPRAQCSPSTSGTSYAAGALRQDTLDPFTIYLFQVWGASSNSVGKGGYASGYLYVEEKTKVYIAVGKARVTCSGKDNKNYAYNGGGYCNGYSLVDYYSGGGASDIRLIGSTTQVENHVKEKLADQVHLVQVQVIRVISTEVVVVEDGTVALQVMVI